MGPLYLLLNAESHSTGQRIMSGLEGFGTTGDGLVTLRVNYHSPRAPKQRSRTAAFILAGGDTNR